MSKVKRAYHTFESEEIALDAAELESDDIVIISVPV